MQSGSEETCKFRLGTGEEYILIACIVCGPASSPNSRHFARYMKGRRSLLDVTSWTSSRVFFKKWHFLIKSLLMVLLSCLVLIMQLHAFEKLLSDYPQWIGNVVMIQVTSPALSDSLKLERQVSELVAHINGEYGSLDFIPVHH